VSLDDAVDLAIRRTARFARRQRAWFRRDPRIQWLDAAGDTGNRLVDVLALAVG
jgi:tRNA dimethylallyltransferase